MSKKYIPITIDRPRNLRFNLAALRFIEETTGRSFLQKFSLEKVQDIAVVLYAGLRHEDKALTLEGVEEMLDLDDIQYVASKIQEAFKATAPASDPTDTARPPEASQQPE